MEHSFEIVKPKTAFVLTFVLLGFDIVSGLIVIATVTMIIIDTYGMCSLWGVDFNALTLINLIAAIGLSIEFTGLCSKPNYGQYKKVDKDSDMDQCLCPSNSDRREDHFINLN